MKRIFFLYITLLFALPSLAQKIQVDEQIDSLEIMLGSQCNLFLTVTAPKSATVMFPDFTEQHLMTPAIEVVDIFRTDSVDLDDGYRQQTVVYTITCFEPKLQYLPPLSVLVNGKKYYGKKLALKVIDVEVDTTKVDKFFPAKDVQKNPFLWEEWLGVMVIYSIAAFLAVASLLVWLIRKGNKPIKLSFRIVKRIPAHIKAMNAIDDIKASKLSLSDNQKDYYTQLTDTLRLYMEERFGFSAMEMTTSEIIERLSTEDPVKVAELREVFETADLVKFAKYSTLVNENDRNLVSAINFINSTKTEEVVVEKKEELNTDEERQSNKLRKIFAIIVYSFAAIATVIVIYCLYLVAMLIE